MNASPPIEWSASTFATTLSLKPQWPPIIMCTGPCSAPLSALTTSAMRISPFGVPDLLTYERKSVHDGST